MELKDQRHFIRVNFAHDVRILTQHSSFKAEVLDISLHGALISEPEQWHEQTQELELCMHLGEASSECDLRIKGRVCHCHGGHIGIEFLKMDIESASRLRRLLELNLGDEKLLMRQFEQLLDTDLSH
ncbi:PilZ domain-containing protein [Celerinatantimonas sp. MCCC 1A17872]|uniref:PilZ domain-containing protein n=1 Tax=Celerinatantimonas sp. MCCC 1A17872 TaxID=3177514 RepID=UPI0038C01197